MTTSKAFPLPNYTQTPNNFFEMIPDMGDAELRVTIVMIRQTFGFHRNGFCMSIKDLCDATGMSRQGVLNGAEAAENRGTFRRTNPDSKESAEWELVLDLHQVEVNLHHVEVKPPPGRGQVGVKESIKENIKQGLEEKMSIENLIFLEKEVKVSNQQNQALRDIAPKMFEKGMGFSKPLPWWSDKEWTEFAEWVCKRYSESKLSFGEYNVWRNTPYTKGGMSNNRIRGFVKEFYDSWDMFMMSKSPIQEEPIRPELVRFTGDEDVQNTIPNPYQKPAILRRPNSFDLDSSE